MPVNLCDSGQVSSRSRSEAHYVGHWLCTRVTERLPGKHSINLYCGAQNQEQQPRECVQLPTQSLASWHDLEEIISFP